MREKDHNVATTKSREWWGWLGAMIWLYFMMYGHDNFIYANMGYYDGSIYPFYFMVILAAAMAVFGFVYGRDPSGLAKISVYTAPIAFVLTCVFPLLQEPFDAILYCASPVFMAPVIVRRVYGVIRTAEPGRRLLRYVSVIAVCIEAFALWARILPPLPREAAFIVPALFIIPAWLGVRRLLLIPEDVPKGGVFRFSGPVILAVMVAVVLLVWLDLSHAVIHSEVASAGGVFNVLGWSLPPIGLMIFALIGDKEQERIGFICGMGIFLVGILIAVMQISSGGDREAVLHLMAFTDAFGGAYTEFFIWTFSIYFLVAAKRPVFVAPLGVVLSLLSSAYLWENAWLPDEWLRIGFPILITAAIAAVLFIVLGSFLLERYQKKSMAAALYTILRGEAAESAPPNAEAAKAPEPADKAAELFTQDERKIALLLIEGSTHHDIARKLHLSSAELDQQIKTIREKVGLADGLPATAAEIAKKFGLTPRETDMLLCLRDGKTNAEIALEYYLSEATVKVHVHNLMNKLPIDRRSDVRAWTDAFAEKAS